MEPMDSSPVSAESRARQRREVMERASDPLSVEMKRAFQDELIELFWTRGAFDTAESCRDIVSYATLSADDRRMRAWARTQPQPEAK